MKQDSPMNGADYLLSHIAQECAEVIVRITKAQHFGLDEIQPGQEFTNRQRIIHEMCDLIALCEVASDAGVLPNGATTDAHDRVDAKKRKAAKFRDYSRELGRLSTNED